MIELFKQFFAPQIRIFTITILLVLLVCIVAGALSGSCNGRKIKRIEANRNELNSNAVESQIIANVAANERVEANVNAQTAANNREAANQKAREMENGNYQVSGETLDKMGANYK